MTTFLLPDLGEGLTESEVVSWHVAEGDRVERDQPLADIETAKAVVELPSPYAGTITKLHAAEGETIAVGAPLIDFEVEVPDDEDDGTDPADTDPAHTDPADTEVADTGIAASPAPEKVQLLVGSITLPGARPARAARRWKVEPFVRRDRVSGLRKHTAEAMARSAQVPQAAAFHQVDVTDTLALTADGQVSFLSLVARAVLRATRRWPDVTATFHADTGELEHHPQVNLGIAVSTDRGLVVAAIDDADRLDAPGLTAAVKDRADRARDGSLTPAELTSATITISNVGVFGVDGGIPLLPPGQSVIVAVGAVRSLPWNHHGRIRLRDVCTVTVSFDHRVLDGREAAGFLSDVVSVLERPGLAFIS